MLLWVSACANSANSEHRWLWAAPSVQRVSEDLSHLQLHCRLTLAFIFRDFTLLFEVVFHTQTDCLPPPRDWETAPWRHHKQATRESIVGYRSPPAPVPLIRAPGFHFNKKQVVFIKVMYSIVCDSVNPFICSGQMKRFLAIWVNSCTSSSTVDSSASYPYHAS